MNSPRTPEDRRSDWTALRQLHPGNRLRLMFGLPLLPQPGYDPDAPERELSPAEKREVNEILVLEGLDPLPPE